MQKVTSAAAESQSKLAICLFLIVFSGTLFVAIFFTESVEGKVVNLLSGLILLLVGGIFGYSGWRQLQESKK